jgi:N-acetylglucosaminyldiphosphoundecaprenol N-acetyl-beta-D-mannosaminyltransferase
MPIEAATTRFVGVDFSQLGWDDALKEVGSAADAPRFTSVVTPNVDHIVRIDRLGDSALGKRIGAAVADADYQFCDSRVLARLARLRGTMLAVVPGSDLTAAIFAKILTPDERIAIIGGDGETVSDLKKVYPSLKITQHIPPMGMINDAEAMDVAAHFIVNTDCRFIFVAVGSPQGEILLHRARQLGATRGVALSIGASIDFLTGRQTRAPRLVQKLGFEWAYRLLSQPKRLWRRYLVDGPRIFAIVMRGGDR